MTSLLSSPTGPRRHFEGIVLCPKKKKLNVLSKWRKFFAVLSGSALTLTSGDEKGEDKGKIKERSKEKVFDLSGARLEKLKSLTGGRLNCIKLISELDSASSWPPSALLHSSHVHVLFRGTYSLIRIGRRWSAVGEGVYSSHRKCGSSCSVGTGCTLLTTSFAVVSSRGYQFPR